MPAEGKCRKLTLSKDKDEKQKTKGICDESKHKEIAKDSPPDYQQLIGTVKNMIKRVETRLESLHLRDSKLSDSDVELFKKDNLDWNKLLAKDEFDLIMKSLSES